MYERVIKRAIDIFCAVLMLTALCWLYALIALLVRVKLGSPVIFKQPRPGKKGADGRERIFCLYKFRTMTDAYDADGNPLPDDRRQTKFGRKLRDWSLDELPEAWNILKGDMSMIGPRPQLVRDMVFMTERQRHRHDVRPGLSGLAQISGRNAISWEDKLEWDLKYIQNVSFMEDARIALKTVGRVFAADDVSADGMATAEDYGDALLRTGKIDRAAYDANQAEAKQLLKEAGF